MQIGSTLKSARIRIINSLKFRFDDDDDDNNNRSDKDLSDEKNSSSTGFVSNTSANGTVHSSQNPSLSLRQRIRFKAPDGGCQHSHSHSHSHNHHHQHEHM